MTPARDVQAETTEKQTTTYVVFRQRTLEATVDGETKDLVLWEQLPGEHTVTAGQGKLAIKAATKDMPAERKNGNFVAVSARSWKPIPRKVETREVDDWS